MEFTEEAIKETRDFVVIRPIGKPEFVMRIDNVYELNGPFQGNPPMVGIIHSYGKKEEAMFHIYKDNYYELKKRLSGDTRTVPDDVIETVAKPASAPDKPPLLTLEK